MQFKYAQIEQALAQHHMIDSDPKTMKTFRARIRNFQKIGLVPSSPGKGQKIVYTTRDAVFWALCFEFVEFGIAPTAIREIMNLKGEELLDYLTLEQTETDEDRYFFMIGLFLQSNMNENGKFVLAHVSGIYTLAQLQKRQIFTLCQRFLMTNLTGLRRSLIESLAHVINEAKRGKAEGNLTVTDLVA